MTSKFSEFIRNATPEEKEEVYRHVMAEVDAKQQQCVSCWELQKAGPDSVWPKPEPLSLLLKDQAC